jgi:hypothetical protein
LTTNQKPAPAPRRRSLAEDLRRIAELRDQGALTPTEYELAKAKLLGR